MDADSSPGGRRRSGTEDYKPWFWRSLRAIERRANLPKTIPRIRPVGSISETSFGFGFRHDCVSGDTVANMNATWATRTAAATYDPTRLVLFGVANDLFNGATEDEGYARISTWCANGRARFPTSRITVVTPKPNHPGWASTTANASMAARLVANPPPFCDEVWNLWAGWPTTAMVPDGHAAIPNDASTRDWDLEETDPQLYGVHWMAHAFWRKLRPDHPVVRPGETFP